MRSGQAANRPEPTIPITLAARVRRHEVYAGGGVQQNRCALAPSSFSAEQARVKRCRALSQHPEQPDPAASTTKREIFMSPHLLQLLPQASSPSRDAALQATRDQRRQMRSANRLASLLQQFNDSKEQL